MTDRAGSGPSGPGRIPRPRRLTLLAIVTVMLLVVAAVAAGITWGAHRPAATQGSAGSPPSGMSWGSVAGQPVPGSRDGGPRRVSGDLADGFSHDELGAALAAFNISTRISPLAGREVYGPTLQRQTVGDKTAVVAQIQKSRSPADPAMLVPSGFWYRVAVGDPQGAEVLLTIAVQTPQSRGMGGFAGTDVRLVWDGQGFDGVGDWRVSVPLPRPRLLPTVDGFVPLGGPDGV